MLKTTLLFLFGLMIFQSAKAQKQIFYFDKNNHMVDTKDSAYYYTVIMPADSTSGKVLYPVKQFYITGTPKMLTASLTNKMGELILDGEFVTFYPNGHRSLSDFMSNGNPNGNMTDYYPNGQIYTIKAHFGNGFLLVECRDSTGKVLAHKGNGKWLELDEDLKNILSDGMVKDSLKEGEWECLYEGKVVTLNQYKNGRFVSGEYFEKSGEKYLYYTSDVLPIFKKDGVAGFMKYLAHEVVYPSYDREHNIQGKVVVTFVVERDGRLTNIKALRGPTEDMENAVIRAVRSCPAWYPGIQNGRPVRVQYTSSFVFGLNQY